MVTGFGPGLKGNFNLGDKVMALLSGGGYAQYVAVPEELLMPVPSHLTLYEAAAIPEAWLTAYQLLHFIGDLTHTESMKDYNIFKALIGVLLLSAFLPS